MTACESLDHPPTVLDGRCGLHLHAPVLQSVTTSFRACEQTLYHIANRMPVVVDRDLDNTISEANEAAG